MIDSKRIKQRAKRLLPLLPALILYIGFLAFAAMWLPRLKSSPWRYFVTLLPMLPGVFLALGIVRVTAQFDELNVSRQTVNAIETGKYDPSLPLAFKLAGLFNRPIEEIFEPDEN